MICAKAVIVGMACATAGSIGAPVHWDTAAGGNGHWYEVIDAQNIGWDAARADAEQLSHLGLQGHLVAVGSAEENLWLSATFGNGFSDPLNWRWMGASRDDADSWQWVTGEAFEFTNWYEGDPRPTYQDWASFAYDIPHPDKGKHWTNSLGSTEVRGYVVEYEAPIPTPATLLLIACGGVAAGQRARVPRA